MRRIVGALLMLVGLGLLLLALARTDGFLRRWLAPVGTWISGIEWVRADLALRAGENWRAYRHAEDALQWSSGDSAVWIYYAHSLLFHEARSTRELEPREREAYARAGLEVLARARTARAQPGEILVYEGAVWAGWAELPEELRPLPCTQATAWQQAIRCFADAQAAGHPLAAGLRTAAEEHFFHDTGQGR